MNDCILVATDGSDHANKALDVASDLARLHNARLCLVHVLLRDKDPADLGRIAEEDGLSPGLKEALARLEQAPHEPDLPEWRYVMDPDSTPSRVPEDLLRHLGEEVLDLASRSSRAKGVEQVSRDLEDGDPVERILAVARREGAATIVMGHRGLRDIDAITLGSVSNKVSHDAECRVVMVK